MMSFLFVRVGVDTHRCELYHPFALEFKGAHSTSTKEFHMTISNHLNVIAAALLFMAEKYRLIAQLAERFEDANIRTAAIETERDARRVVALLGSDGLSNVADSALALGALGAFADELNRKTQSLFKANAVQEASMIEHRVREVYAAAASVRSHIVGLSPVAAQ
jgi:hypothetical protein